MKICSVCKVLKPFTEFHAHRALKDGLTAACKNCRNARNRKYVWARKSPEEKEEFYMRQERANQKQMQIKEEERKKKEEIEKKGTNLIQRQYPCNRKRWTIEKCLILLGAPESEVRLNARRGGKCLHYNSVRGVYPVKILDHMAGGEILYWAKNLYKDVLSLYHPDKNLQDTELCNNRCQEASEAFTRLRRILKHHGAVEA
jgi:hypothetical protein